MTGIRMIRRIYDTRGWLEALHECLDLHPDNVRISTMSVAAGLLEDGIDVRRDWGKEDPVGNLLDRLSTVPTWLLVGNFPAKDNSPGRNCRDCRVERLRQLSRLAYHARAWPSISWGVMQGVVPQTAVFCYPDGTCRALAGNHNLNEWAGAGTTFLLEGADLSWDIREFDGLWAQARPAETATWDELSRVRPPDPNVRRFSPMDALGLPMPAERVSQDPAPARDQPIDDIPF